MVTAVCSRIWLIGGTGESAELVRLLIASGIPCTVSVTTLSAQSLYPKSPLVRVWVGRLSADELPKFLQDESIRAILDASHPFAVEISRLAIATAQQLSLPYLRFERPALTLSQAETIPHTLDSLLNSNILEGHRVLLTLGYRWLEKFRPWQARATLFARILPSPEALTMALAAGFTADRLIALRPPISADLERALWEQWQITCVVTKASGTPGGEAVKREVAQTLGITLVVLERPWVEYPHQTDSLQVALKICQQWWQTISSGSKQIR
ncbi:MAG TPA: cobalt-precorrin-6A reductase [Trichocoleus sp.]